MNALRRETKPENSKNTSVCYYIKKLGQAIFSWGIELKGSRIYNSGFCQLGDCDVQSALFMLDLNVCSVTHLT